MIEGRFFVTPHAVGQFQARIARLPYERARQAIIDGLAETKSEPKPLHSGGGVMIRVRRPYAFRAVVVRGVGEYPAVATILRSGKGRGRARR